MAREFVIDPDWTPRDQTPSRNDPPDRGESDKSEQAKERPVARSIAVRGERQGGALRPGAGEREELEEDADPDPEGQPAAIAAERGRDGQMAAPAPGEEIDRRDHERQQGRDQDQLNCP